MATQRIEFTEWTPDQPSVVRNLSKAEGVYATAVGYSPFPTAVDYSQSASESLNNVFAGRFYNTNTIFSGGTTKLFKLDSADYSMVDVSKTGGYSGVEKWNFVQFGNTILAANNIDKLQAFTLGSGTQFADAGAAAPVSKYVTIVRDFVVCANLNSGTDSSTVIWSDINDYTDWVAGGASQSDSQILPDGGNITGLSGGEFGLIFLQRAIVRMSYIGSPYFFQFDTISRNLGCLEGNSIVQHGGITYFLAENGFYSCDGHNIEAIGNEKIDRYFFKDADPSALNTISATVDPIRKIVIWNFKNVFAQRELIIYNWQTKKWTTCDTDTNYVASLVSSGTTLEGLDFPYEINASSMVAGREYTITNLGTSVNWTSIGASTAVVGARFTRNSTALSGTGGKVIDLATAAAAGYTLDTMTTSMDSYLYTGGKFLLAGARGTKIVSFTGANASAQIDTGYIGSQYNSTVTLARPIVDNGSADVSIYSVNLLNETKDFGTYTSADSENRVALRSNGKYHKLSIKPTGSQWSNALAVEIEIQPQGVR
jgi:hypothetical protein